MTRTCMKKIMFSLKEHLDLPSLMRREALTGPQNSQSKVSMRERK